jgi:hypothetical protein
MANASQKYSDKASSPRIRSLLTTFGEFTTQQINLKWPGAARARSRKQQTPIARSPGQRGPLNALPAIGTTPVAAATDQVAVVLGQRKLLQ